MDIERIHHVAYRCKDARQTVQWYEQHLDMKFVLAIAENQEHLFFRPQRPPARAGLRHRHTRDVPAARRGQMGHAR